MSRSILAPVVIRVATLVACGAVTGCADTLVRPAPGPVPRPSEALLILPGFGYGSEGERVLTSLAASMTAEGLSVYVPIYISRHGLEHGRERLRAFMREERFDPRRLEDQPNLATVIYDRSPLQERAPQIAVDDLPLLAWLRYGSSVFQVARTEYPPLTAPHVRVGLMVETRPTSFVRGHASTARRYGAPDFDCHSMRQRYDDCLYLPMSHDEVYLRFADIWPEIRRFTRTGRFSDEALRTPPAIDPLSERRGR